MFQPSPTLSRRRALKQILCYSAALALAPAARVLRAAAPAADERHFLMIGDFGRQEGSDQRDVAAAMQKYVQQKGIKTDALFLLGDNFYGDFEGGVKCPRWKAGFEDMYPASAFPGPCFATLGNHDYDEVGGMKVGAELGYAAATPGTRWTMPAKWYRLDWPKENPLFTWLMLDSNYENRTNSLTPEEKTQQMAWLKTELAKPRTAPWLFAAGHHPVYSNAQHGDQAYLIKDWDPLFQEHNVSHYFCGHDHDLQHLEFEGHRTSYVVSGGGGAKVYQTKHPERGPFNAAVQGFTHLQVSRERVIVRHLDPNVTQLHAFSKTPDGRVEVVS